MVDDKRHLICEPYSVAGLHEMAKALGIKRCWYHSGKHRHYDVPKRRVGEIGEHPLVEQIATRDLYRIIGGLCQRDSSMNDKELRMAVKRKLLARYAGVPEVLVLEEVGLRHGSGRVDLAVVNSTIHGFELKSDLDNLNRLPHQIQIYNSVLDKVTLIVGRRHVDAAIVLIPDWWFISDLLRWLSWRKSGGVFVSG